MVDFVDKLKRAISITLYVYIGSRKFQTETEVSFQCPKHVECRLLFIFSLLSLNSTKHGIDIFRNKLYTYRSGELEVELHTI